VATANIDTHYTKGGSSVKGFDKDASYGTSCGTYKLYSGWDSNFPKRKVTKVVMNLQVCLRG
jgi:hypothetical protein